MEVTDTQMQAMSLDPGTWRCMVCTKPSNQMQVLPCQHKFCCQCLKLWAMIYIDMYNGYEDEFPCQVCWKRYAVPPQGLEAFEQDYQVKLLQETMKLMNMGQEQTREPTQKNPFCFTPQNNLEESDYMQQPYNAHPTGGNDTAEQVMEPSTEEPCTPPVINMPPSMVSHMVPTPLTGTMDHRLGPGYCYRSHQMFMHMI